MEDNILGVNVNFYHVEMVRTYRIIVEKQEYMIIINDMLTS